MSNQEVWITIRIKSELAVESPAAHYAKRLASSLCNTFYYRDFDYVSHNSFLLNATDFEVVEVKEEKDIYDLR